MNRIIAICLLTFLLIFSVENSRAVLTDWQLPASQAYIQDYTNLLSGLGSVNSNFIGATNEVDQNLYHSIHFFCSTNSNGLQFSIDNSLDTTNWVFGATNSFGVSGGSFETNFVAKKAFLRMRLTGTNVVGTANYLGGR